MAAFDFMKFSNTALGGLFGGIQGAINYNHNKELMKLQNQYTQQNMLLSNQLNRDFQEFVWKNEIPMNVTAMKAAGLNPAGANTSLSGAGNVGNSLVSSAPSSHPSDFDLLSGISAIANMNMLREQAEGVRLDNERKTIENKNLKDENDYLDKPSETYFVNPDTNERLSDSELFEWRSKHAQGLKESLPAMVVTPKNSKGIMQAKQFAAENKANITSANARELASTLDIDVNKARLSPSLHDNIVKSIASLPIAERNKLNEEIKRNNLENYITQWDIDNLLPKQLEQLGLMVDEQRLTTFSGLINTLKSDEIDGWEKFLAAIGFAIKTISGSHISFPTRNSKTVVVGP